jgi:hypothetical protein
MSDKTWELVYAVWRDARTLRFGSRPLTPEEIEMLHEVMSLLSVALAHRKAA